MRKHCCLYMTPLVLLLLLTAFVGASVNVSANAKQRRQSTSTKKKKQSSTAKSVKSKRSTGKLSASKTTRRGKVSKRSVSEKKTTARGSQISSKQVQRLFRKRGKLTRNERAILNKYRSSRSRRARARYLARMRALRARDSALRNIAAGNILKDDTGGEDLEIRSAALNALNGRSGTVVVMDPNTGRILSIVNQKMALGSPVKPCSTVKMIVGLAALHEGVFDPNEDVKFSTNASMNLTDAVARSNNPVFQVLGRMLGFERLINYAGNYGFGEKTGVNYPNESTGFLPEDGEQETGHMSSHGDGFGVTAIQLAAFTGAIANGGYLYVPRVARSIEEANDFAPELKRRIVMSPEDRLRMMSGMIGAINYGTGKLAYNPLGQVAGKTGTCTGNRDKLGLFTSFSSVDDPKLVVTVITTGSTEAGRRAAEIAGRIYSAISPRYFRDRLSAPAAAGAEIPDGQDKNN